MKSTKRSHTAKTSTECQRRLRGVKRPAGRFDDGLTTRKRSFSWVISSAAKKWRISIVHQQPRGRWTLFATERQKQGTPRIQPFNLIIVYAGGQNECSTLYVFKPGTSRVAQQTRPHKSSYSIHRKTPFRPLYFQITYLGL
ncbi:hypothetical protein M408DRAFT_170492 [Serendipita vermifera MAFF 305830]|uniref:Uncharacterized protein n=1 Tax=Serendipita vermifera MAFF 305830 TaxID=933852 RepID=A0A0C2WLJ7_SERVB|nr:hypothetical protein M408DRAFT_170492 [Serendipita vermifera MAFF 305830]